MAFTEKTIKILTILIAISVLGLGGVYYVYPLVMGEPEQPPSINISTSKFQGLLKKEDVCKLPGYEFTKAMVDEYKEPESISEDQKYDLLGGDHLYHSDEELSIKEILDFIVPVEGNKVIIAYYSPSYLTSNKTNGFNLYPKIGGTNEITDPNNFKIEPNQGFAILSCEDTKIWKVKDEKTAGGETLPSLIGNGLLSNDWLLVPMVKDKKIDELLTEDVQKAVTSVWLQKSQGFDFEKVGLGVLDGDYTGYYMAWFKVDKSILATLDKDEPEAEVNVEEIIEDTMQDVTNPPDPNSTGADGVDAQIETTGEAQIEQTIEEATNDTPYGGQGLQFDIKETLDGGGSDKSDIESAVNSTIESENTDAPQPSASGLTKSIDITKKNAEKNEVIIEWTDTNGGNAYKYLIYRSTSSPVDTDKSNYVPDGNLAGIKMASAPQTFTDDKLLNPSTKYYYKIISRTQDNKEIGTSNEFEVTTLEATEIVIFNPAGYNFLLSVATKIEIIKTEVAKYSSTKMGTDVTVTYKITGNLDPEDKIYLGGNLESKTVAVGNDIKTDVEQTIILFSPYDDTETTKYGIIAEVWNGNNAAKAQMQTTVEIPKPVNYADLPCALDEYNDTEAFWVNCHPRIKSFTDTSIDKCDKPSWCPGNNEYENNKFDCTSGVWGGSTCNIYTP